MTRTNLFTKLFLLFFLLLRAASQQQRACQKINFDTQQPNGLEKCPNINQQFVKKSYINSRQIKPYRVGADYYLSNEWGRVESCGQTEWAFSLDEHSIVQMTNFLIFEDDAYMTVRVIDLDEGSRVVLEWELDASVEEWRVFNRTVDRAIARAKIMIFCSMNDQSTFAIEHLHIINTAIENDECREDDWDPKTTETTSSGTTTVSTSSPSQSTTTVISTTPTTVSSTSSSSLTTSSSTPSQLTTTITTSSSSQTSQAEPTSTEEEATTTSSGETETETFSTTEEETEEDTEATTTPETPNRQRTTIFYFTITLVFVLAVIGVTLLVFACCYTYQIYHVAPYRQSSSLERIIPSPPPNYSAATYNVDGSMGFNDGNVTHLPRLKVDNTSPIGLVITDNNHQHVQNIDLAAWTMDMDKKYGDLSDKEYLKNK